MPITVEVVCPCCPAPENVLYSMSAELGHWQAAIADGTCIRQIACIGCGCQFNLADNIATIGQTNVSPPRVDGLSVATGPVSGGTPVILTGHALNYGALIVKFDGVVAPGLRDQSGEYATVDTPVGRVKLNTQGAARRRLAISSVSGVFQVGETIVGNQSLKTAIVREIGSVYLYVDTASGDFTTNETVTGNTSGATAKAGAFGNWQDGESIAGLTSLHSGTLVGTASAPIKVSNPTGGYTAAEWVRGVSSGTKIQLAAANHKDGSVVVSVENEHGCRPLGGRLAGAFAYAI